MKNVLYLGSKSQSRRMLLQESFIPFIIVDQDADEHHCDWSLPLGELVLTIALYKMEHTLLPDGKHEGDICFVLTADTMAYDINGLINAKPKDKQEAIDQIKMARYGSSLYTGFCIDKKMWCNNAWILQERIAEVVTADFVVAIADDIIEEYLSHIPFLDVAGSIAIERYGNQFLKTVSGSYSAIVGLPLFEVRQALTQLGFFER